MLMCEVPGCPARQGRLRGKPEPDPARHWFICAEHWRATAPQLRRTLTAARRARRRDLMRIAAEKLRRQAIERAMGI